MGVDNSNYIYHNSNLPPSSQASVNGKENHNHNQFNQSPNPNQLVNQMHQGNVGQVGNGLLYSNVSTARENEEL